MGDLLLSCKKLLKVGPASGWGGCEVAHLYQYAKCYEGDKIFASFLRELNMLPAPIEVAGYFEAFAHLLNFSYFDEMEIRLILQYEIEYRYVEMCPYVVCSWTHTNESLQYFREITETHLDQVRKNLARMENAATQLIHGKVCVPTVYKDISRFINS